VRTLKTWNLSATSLALADAYLGEDPIDQVSGRFGHSPSAAGAAKSSFLTGEGHDLLLLAVRALEPQEAMGQNPAPEEGFEFLGDMLREMLS
jgi:hypothetical protein